MRTGKGVGLLPFGRRTPLLLGALLLCGAASTQGCVSGAAHEAIPWEVSFDERPSHNRRYRAELRRPVEHSALPASAWVLALRLETGEPIEGASVHARLWKPESGQVGQNQPVVRPCAPGLYLVDPLIPDGPGWWNLALEIAANTGTDSLAFNFVVGRSPR